MNLTNTQPQHLAREFLPIRAKILEIAAALDRIQRVAVEDVDDPRWQQLQEGLRLLLEVDNKRTEQVQLLFSRAYDERWRETFANAPGKCD